VIGFGLHNITEGFGIAAPMASSANRPSWRFLALAGVIGGAPTFVGTLVGYRSASVYLFVLFLALAAGALIYVINETLSAGRKLTTQAALGWGLLIGFLAGYSTDLFLTFAGG
jgi:ZIP family zinc transporter